MKIRFCAGLLLTALNVQLLTGCASPITIQPRVAEPAPAIQTIPPTPVPLTPAAPATEPTAPPASRPTSVYAKLLTKEEATAIALQDAGFTADQVTRLRTEFDYDDGRPEYEVDFHQGGYEYDYEIHAETGKILAKDMDRED